MGLLLILALPAPALTEEISGRASVVDGDTLSIEGIADNVRLNRIDAPEGGQRCMDAAGDPYLCGTRAADALAAMIGRNGHVRCETEGQDRYERWLGTCFLGRTDLNASMVVRGWALEYTRYSDGRYQRYQDEARAERRGLWQGDFVAPWEWRQGERIAGNAPEAASAEGCEIKGNISANGQIYHLPGQRFYDRTRIDESAGERWFCSEAEAQGAGWTRARG